MEELEISVSSPIPASCDVATEPGAAHDADPRRCMSPKFRRACLHLGMTSEALDWWERIHVQSEVGMLCFFSSLLLSSAMLICLFLGSPASGPYAYAFRVPSVFSLLCGVVQFFAWWRLGHSNHGPKLQALHAVAIPCTLTVSFLGYLCPPEFIPFQSSLQYTAVLGVMTFAILSCLACDPEVLAPEPIKSVISLLPSVCVRTLRALDCYTDFSFLQVLSTQKSEGCWWFGIQGRCGVYAVLQICAWTLTILDLTASSTITMLTLKDVKSGGSKRVLYINVFSAFCEIGLITITFLHVLSKHQNNEGASSGNHSDNVAIVVVSLATTLLTLSLTIMGAGSVLKGLKVVATRVRVNGAKLEQKRRSQSGQKVVPIKGPASSTSSSGDCARPLIVESPVVCDATVYDPDSGTDETFCPSVLKDS